MGHRPAKRRVTMAGAVTLLAGVGLGAPPAGAGAVAAQKMPLTQTNRACDAAAVDGGEQAAAFGSVAVTRPASGKLVATARLEGARPSTVYAVRLIQVVPGDADCRAVDGFLTTDDLGSGKATVEQKLLPGATRAWLVLNGQDDFTHFYDSAPVSF